MNDHVNRLDAMTPILNVYPDSVGGTLGEAVEILRKFGLSEAFGGVYILPSLFHSDLDRGFSVIDYSIDETLASVDDIDSIKNMGLFLKLDFVLNHASVLSPQFQDILINGEASEYRDFFIDWNAFWEGAGEMTPAGYIEPRTELIQGMHFRKPGLPLLPVRFPDGRSVPFWNTFYQEVRPDETDERRRYLGQMDLNVKSEKVWDFYRETLARLAEYGAALIRLDAFAYASKDVGARNFMNEPGTFNILSRLRGIADEYGLTLLPEIHARYEEKVHQRLSEMGYLTYDFFLPGLILHAIESGTNRNLIRWINEIQSKGIRTVNMLGCHDGIPLLDLKGLLSDDEIEKVISTVVSRGGLIKDLHGQQNVYYQVNSTYYSALGEDDSKMLLARAIQLFMPGIPQVWYLDLFAGTNDLAAVGKAGSAGHKEINRTNLTLTQIENAMTRDVVGRQVEMLKWRKACPAFGGGAVFTIIDSNEYGLRLRWNNDGNMAELRADLKNFTFEIC
jgi:sucrose phosphorylase